MKKKFSYTLYSAVLIQFLLLLSACSSDDLSGTKNPNDTNTPPVETEDSQGNVVFYKPDLVDDNFILINDAESNRVYLMDKDATILHEWSLTNNIGNDVFLLPNGKLLASLEADDPKMAFGGQGGKLQFVDYDSNVEWEFVYSSEDAEIHHDAELLPNGNIIALVWERKTAQEAEQAGSNLGIDVFPEAVIEVDPDTDEIVWEWHAWDHLVQDFDESRDNFGVIAENPERIDVNYVQLFEGDIMHANGIAYDAGKDLIYISVNFFSEVWVIDHSTTPEEAASQTGGNYGKGGDLVYRFGNPEAYGNTAGERRFYNNHFPNLLQGTDYGKMLIFGNKTNNEERSTVYELQLPGTFSLEPGSDNEPEVLWSFTHPDLFSAKVSGAVPLPNGNILITEGDFGLWEITREGELVWQFKEQGFYWRGYHYDKDAPEIQGIGF